MVRNYEKAFSAHFRSLYRTTRRRRTVEHRVDSAAVSEKKVLNNSLQDSVAYMLKPVVAISNDDFNYRNLLCSFIKTDDMVKKSVKISHLRREVEGRKTVALL